MSLCELYRYLDHIPVVDSSISPKDFFGEYLLKNQACIVKNATTGWNCAKKWILPSEELNFSHLYSQYGDLDVTIYDCGKRQYNSQITKRMKLAQYLVYLEALGEVKDGGKEVPLLYLKDWHLAEQRPLDDFYEVPAVFRLDWLNEFLVENSMDDYRFVYIGPKGSWTPFHADVFTSYSWSANVTGKKLWILFPPGEEDHLKDSLGNLPYDIHDLKTQARHFKIIQEKTDAVFVPSGWHHQVLNLETTISINHNWFNGYNIRDVWLSMKKHHCSVLREIEDCVGMEGFRRHAQLMLRASYGMDFEGFYELIGYIVRKRLKFLEDQSMDSKYVVFDLKRADEVLSSMSQDPDVLTLDELCKKMAKDGYCDKIKIVLSKQ